MQVSPNIESKRILSALCARGEGKSPTGAHPEMAGGSRIKKGNPVHSEMDGH